MNKGKSLLNQSG